MALPKLPQEKIIKTVKPPHQHDDIWQRIRSQLTIEVPDNKEVAKWRKYYLSHPNFMITISQRAEPFLYYIIKEIEKRGMPLELALLPIVESSYIPFDGFQIQHLSDTHLDDITDLTENIIAEISLLYYGMCVITGDFFW